MLTSIMPESFIYGHHHPENHQDEKKQVYRTATLL